MCSPIALLIVLVYSQSLQNNNNKISHVIPDQWEYARGRAGDRPNLWEYSFQPMSIQLNFFPHPLLLISSFFFCFITSTLYIQQSQKFVVRECEHISVCFENITRVGVPSEPLCTYILYWIHNLYVYYICEVFFCCNFCVSVKPQRVTFWKL